jgi:UDP-N-acetylmuramoylalanine--D-glutamate ligase
MALPKNKIKTFTFLSYHLDKKRGWIDFFYAFDTEKPLKERIILPKRKINWEKINPDLLDKVLFALHLALGIGYYKAYCPSKIIIKSNQLNNEQALFWNKLYHKGLGEFFYKNKIDPRGLINFPAEARDKKITSIKHEFKDRCLSPIGGGKDSCLSAEILKELNKEFCLISLRDSSIQRETSDIIGAPRLIFGREIDQKLFDLNKQGALNGHIPISAIYSWISVLAAIIFDYRQIVFANEASANFGNTLYHGEEINHQYSKSWEFEKDLAAYLTKFISPDLYYFSLLRPYSELKIAQKFSQYPQYFPAFSSCNRNFKIQDKSKKRWCGECPKCAFSFSLLAAFNSPAVLKKIFGRNLLATNALLPIFQELWGEKRIKPFDCVGTPEEVKAAFLLIARRQSWQKSPIVNYFTAKIAPRIKDKEALITTALRRSQEHSIPENFRKTIIIGGAFEGQALYRYYRQRYKHLPLWLADQKKLKSTQDKNLTTIFGPHYLDSLDNFDVIAKSQGVPELDPQIFAALASGIELTSVTKLFFAQKHEQIIGVTGTKGKSTSSSLIYAILKAAGKEVYLVGNIGADPLALLDKGKKAYFIYELSSYQLATLKQSPHIAVFINIFPDHLPYHNGFKNYQEAKANITRYQDKNDFFIYNGDYPFIKNLAAKTPAKSLEYSSREKREGNYLYYQNKKILPLTNIKLPGKHNLKNISAAITAAKILKIKDKDIIRAISSFSGLPHRLQFIGRYKNIAFYDDAISTTPESTMAAIDYLGSILGTIFLGGLNRGYDFKKLAKKLSSLEIDAIVLFPDSGAQIKTALLQAYKHKKLPMLLETKDMAAAVQFAYRHTQKNRACLLSTASPSYSIFKNFQEKGDLFQKSVKKFQK